MCACSHTQVNKLSSSILWIPGSHLGCQGWELASLPTKPSCQLLGRPSISAFLPWFHLLSNGGSNGVFWVYPKSMHTHTPHVCTGAHTQKHTYTLANTHTRIYTHTRVCVCVHMSTHTVDKGNWKDLLWNRYSKSIMPCQLRGCQTTWPRPTHGECAVGHGDSQASVTLFPHTGRKLEENLNI